MMAMRLLMVSSGVNYLIGREVPKLSPCGPIVYTDQTTRREGVLAFAPWRRTGTLAAPHAAL
jgi:hypothetical protein